MKSKVQTFHACLMKNAFYVYDDDVYVSFSSSFWKYLHPHLFSYPSSSQQNHQNQNLKS